MGQSWLSAGRPTLRGQRLALQLASYLHHRYEDEINKRTNAENDFVVMKKVMERGVLRELRIGEERSPGNALCCGQGDPWAGMGMCSVQLQGINRERKPDGLCFGIWRADVAEAWCRLLCLFLAREVSF